MTLDIIYHSGRISHGKIRDKFIPVFGEESCRFHATSLNISSYDIALGVLQQGGRTLVACGGDGTLSEVANAILEKQINEGITGIRLGVFPVGTANDFVKSMHISKDPAQLKELIDSNSLFQMDVGCLKHANNTHYFINAMDAGMGADAIANVQKMPRWMGGKAAYKLGIVKSLMSYKNRRMRLVLDGEVVDGFFRMVIVANGKFIGEGHCVAPGGCLDDGLLEVLSVGDVTLFDYVKQTPKLKRSEYIEHPHVFYRTVRTVELLGDAMTELDGEFGPPLPVKISVVPKALSVYAPKDQ